MIIIEPVRCHATKRPGNCIGCWSQNLVSLTSMAVPFYGITAGNITSHFLNSLYFPVVNHRLEKML